jgi:hypothetical protein
MQGNWSFWTLRSFPCPVARARNGGCILCFSPFSQKPANVVLTDSHEGEHIRRVGIQPRDIALADRGYGTWSNLRPVLEEKKPTASSASLGKTSPCYRRKASR